MNQSITPSRKEFETNDRRLIVSVSDSCLHIKNHLKSISHEIGKTFYYDTNSGIDHNLGKLKRFAQVIFNKIFPSENNLQLLGQKVIGGGTHHTNMIKVVMEGKNYLVKVSKKFYSYHNGTSNTELAGLHELGKKIKNNQLGVDVLYPLYAIYDKQTGYQFIMYPYIDDFITIEKAYKKKIIDKERYQEICKYLESIEWMYTVKLRGGKERSIFDIRPGNTSYDRATGKTYIFDTMTSAI